MNQLFVRCMVLYYELQSIESDRFHVKKARKWSSKPSSVSMESRTSVWTCLEQPCLSGAMPCAISTNPFDKIRLTG